MSKINLEKLNAGNRFHCEITKSNYLIVKMKIDKVNHYTLVNESNGHSLWEPREDISKVFGDESTAKHFTKI